MRSWHGSGDSLVPIGHMEHLIGLLPDARLDTFEGEGHFAGCACVPAVLDCLMEMHRNEPTGGAG